METFTEAEILSLEDVLNDVEIQKSLILYNDDFNTFDYVIDSLIEVCDHQAEQAEQCAFFVHYKGKCEIKNGTFNKLKPMRTELNRRGLDAKIE